IGGNYYVAGVFNTAGNVQSPGIAEFTPSASQWTALSSALGSDGSFSGSTGISLAEGSAGLFVGGNFALAGGIPAESIALWNATAGSTTGSQAPTNSSPPGITGSAVQGQTLTETHGTWSVTPTSYAYQWEDCDGTGANCKAISGATAQSYTLTATDLQHTIRVQEFATAAGGTGGPATSSPTAPVSAASGGGS